VGEQFVHLRGDAQFSLQRGKEFLTGGKAVGIGSIDHSNRVLTQTIGCDETGHPQSKRLLSVEQGVVQVK